MCGRFTLQTNAQTLAKLFDGLNVIEFKPRYNIAPTQTILALRAAKDNHADREFVWLRWGLVPAWAKELKIGASMINARSETVATKPSFRSAFKRRRCLILADGFYEWKKRKGGKQPFLISRCDQQPFCLAGLWESWTDPAVGDVSNNPVVETCTILTTTPNELLSTVHDRMPVVLSDEAQQIWLDQEQTEPGLLESLLVPAPAKDWKLFPVSTAVNRATHDQPDCIIPLTE